MILFKRLSYIPALLIAVVAFTSCDNEINTIGGELIGGGNNNLPIYQAGVTASSINLPPVQTNGLPVHLLGVYKEPVYGVQVANVLTQVSLSGNNPDFGNEPQLDSVVLTLPYFSTKLEPDEDGNVIYRLDSLYGNSPFKLSIFKSNYFLNDFDPETSFEERQKYFSDQSALFEANLSGEALFVSNSFLPSRSEVVYFEEDDEGEMDTLRVSPRARIHLPVQFFKEAILDKEGTSVLSNSNNFKNYFRGIYFKAEPVNGEGSMFLMNFANNEAGITLYYTNFAADTEDEDSDGDVTELVGTPDSYKLNLGGNTVNTFIQELPASIAAEIEASNEETGAENIFLKGGEGSMAVINLFEDEAELEDLRSRGWLINEANLTFFVNQDYIEGGKSEPERIFLYNLETNETLLDYRLDVPDPVNPLNSITNHSERLERTEDGDGISYKIRITEHVKKILNNDSTNVKLGLVVSQNFNLLTTSALKEPVNGIKMVPSTSVISPRGTVLHGNLAEDEAKRIKFNIIYTETNN